MFEVCYCGVGMLSTEGPSSFGTVNSGYFMNNIYFVFLALNLFSHPFNFVVLIPIILAV